MMFNRIGSKTTFLLGVAIALFGLDHPCSAFFLPSNQFFGAKRNFQGDVAARSSNIGQTHRRVLLQLSERRVDDTSHKTPSPVSFVVNTHAETTKQLQRRAPSRGRFPTTTLASLSLACALFLFPLSAQAGFGPSGGATTSKTPGVASTFDVNELSSKKLRQLIDSSLDENRLNDFQAQLEVFIESINNTLNQATAAFNEANSDDPSISDDGVKDLSATEEKTNASTKKIRPSLTPAEEEQLEKARAFQAQIVNRERLLDKLEAQPWWFNYFAAFCGSVVSTLIMHPVDTIKTRLQSRVSNSSDDENGVSTAAEQTNLFENLYEGLTGNICKEGPPSALYLGVYEAVKSSLMHGKLASLWAGLGAAVATKGAVPATAAKVATIGSNPANLLTIYLVAGAAGELVGSTVRAPAEAVKSMVQTQAASTTGEAVEMVLGNSEGRQNVFRAWSASLFRDVPFGAIQLALFELIKAFILNNPDIDFDSSSLQSELIIGAFAGGCGALLTTPTDVITTRIITQSQGSEDEGKEDQALGVIGMGRRVYEEGGVGAFFTGWQARVLYWAPAISLFLTCYCSVRQMGVKLDLFG